MEWSIFLLIFGWGWSVRVAGAVNIEQCRTGGFIDIVENAKTKITCSGLSGTANVRWSILRKGSRSQDIATCTPSSCTLLLPGQFEVRKSPGQSLLVYRQPDRAADENAKLTCKGEESSGAISTADCTFRVINQPDSLTPVHLIAVTVGCAVAAGFIFMLANAVAAVVGRRRRRSRKPVRSPALATASTTNSPDPEEHTHHMHMNTLNHKMNARGNNSRPNEASVAPAPAPPTDDNTDDDGYLIIEAPCQNVTGSNPARKAKTPTFGRIADNLSTQSDPEEHIHHMHMNTDNYKMNARGNNSRPNEASVAPAPPPPPDNNTDDDDYLIIEAPYQNVTGSNPARKAKTPTFGRIADNLSTQSGSEEHIDHMYMNIDNLEMNARGNNSRPNEASVAPSPPPTTDNNTGDDDGYYQNATGSNPARKARTPTLGKPADDLYEVVDGAPETRTVTPPKNGRTPDGRTANDVYSEAYDFVGGLAQRSVGPPSASPPRRDEDEAASKAKVAASGHKGTPEPEPEEVMYMNLQSPAKKPSSRT